MAIYPITVYGDKILRKVVQQVKDIDDKTIKEIKSMFSTMRHAHGMGLAANQVGIDKSIFVIDISPIEGYEKLKPIVMINPKIVLSSEENELFEEGCLSVPNINAEVERPSMIKIVYFDTDMKEITLETDKLLARVIQHEYDHLHGKFFTDRIPEKSRKKLNSDLKKIMNRDIEIDYEITEREK